MELAKSILDKYFATKKIKSTTAHSNSHGIVVTVRFSHDDLHSHGDSSVPVSDSEPQGTVSYKRVSDKQAKRSQKHLAISEIKLWTISMRPEVNLNLYLNQLS